MFCSLEALNELISMTHEQFNGSDAAKNEYSDAACAIEIIELPFTLVWTDTTDDVMEVAGEIGFPDDFAADAMMFVYNRFENGTSVEDIQALRAVIHADSNVIGRCNNPAVEPNLNAFYTAANGVNRFLQYEGLYEKYRQLDPEIEGVRIELEGLQDRSYLHIPGQSGYGRKPG